MGTDHRAELPGIKRFDQLVRYLREEMGWPIDGDDFEELTFEYTPEELGIDASNAAKIQEIKRLRPLSAKQPWGIFFVKFEPKRLPVVALRRILSQVALKKRASANNAERAAWAADDLLFISNYGTGDERQISFAHFSQGEARSDLPTLKVLGWDNLDTALHLDAVAMELTQHLSWPDDDTDAKAWRQRWRAAFTLRHREVITTSMGLSIRLAKLARDICDRIKSALAIESARGPLTKLMTAFRESLVHDLDADGFADMYAQTIAYGLLSARIADPTRKTADDFAAHMRTSPFLRELMETFLHVGGRRGKAGGPGIDFDELGVSEVTALLDQANMEAVVRDFGDRNRQEDPVIHFYELFLTAYDKQKKIQRGVFYTPQPVVSYIVRSVHELLQTEFGLADGLADTATWGEMLKKHSGLKLPPLTDEPGEKRTISLDEPFVQILDPATGTATFVVEVIDVIYRTLEAKWQKQRLTDTQQNAAWNEYVPRHLLPRLHAFELMMAPYAIAHMKVGLKLAETGYRFDSEERARIYLTNALEPWVSQLPLIGFDALAHEAAAVNEIKRHKRFTVVIGNPPYAGHSWNLTPELRKIIDPYRFAGGERIKERGALQLEKNLQDDYVKFVCFDEQKIKAAGVGVTGLVTSHGFLDNLFLRGMRSSLLSTYDDLFILDLHGNVLRGEKCPDGSPDKNVFDIKQTGVAISLCTRHISPKDQKFRHADLWGDRENIKIPFLLHNTVISTKAELLRPAAPSWAFVPRDASLLKEYESSPSLVDVMPLRSLAAVTGRDAFVVDEDKEALVQRMVAFAASDGSEAELDKQFGLRSSTWWSSIAARSEMPKPSEVTNFIRSFNYRPFDRRFCFYHSSVFESLRRPVMRHLDPGRKNVVLITTRMVKGEPFAHTFVSDGLVEAIGLSSKTSNSAYVFPLFIYPDNEDLLNDSQRRANFSTAVLSSIERAFCEPPKPEEVFHYAYAVFHSPGYRSRYAELLKIDFPRLPLTGDLELFRELARLGSELTAVHLMQSLKLNKPITEFIGGANPEVEKVSWSLNTVWVDKAQTIGFGGVREDVWNFYIGGYRVCEKWLKDRKGRNLTKGDLAHYQEIVVALAETIRLMAEIDTVIDAHGGWPAAFQGIGGGRAGDRISPEARNVIAFPSRALSLSPSSGDADEAPSLHLAAEPTPRGYADLPSASTRALNGVVPGKLLMWVRHVFADRQDRTLEAAVDEIGRAAGHEPLEAELHADVVNTLRIAVRRGILDKQGNILRLLTRRIEDYERAFLKDQFVASLEGRRWTERTEAVRGFARWLGFRRTGQTIEDIARSLINGLLREGRLEAQDGEIRRT